MKPNGTKTKKVMLIKFKFCWMYYITMAWQTNKSSNFEILTVMNWKQKKGRHINRVYPYELNGV